MAPRAEPARRLLRRAWAGGLLLAALAAPAAAQSSGEPYAVIVHPSTRADEVSLLQLRQIFLGEQQFWPGSDRIALVLHAPGTPERAVALRQLYRMDEREFRRYWISRTFRHDAVTGPKIVSSTALAKKVAARIPGAIAIVPAAAVDATVKVLRVNGRLPGSPGYPLVSRTPED